VERHNVRLFDRSGRRLIVTDAGQVLLDEAERILRDVELTIRRVENLRNPDERRPIVACSRNAYDYWMPGLIARMGGQKDMPNIDLIWGTCEEVTSWVMRGTADAGVTESVPGHPQLRYLGIFGDQLILCATTARAQALPPSPSWKDLPDCAPVVWEESDLSALIVEALAAQHIEAKRIARGGLRLHSTAAVISVIASGRYAGFVTYGAARAELATGALVRLGQIEIPLRYWMFAPREREIEPLAALIAKAATELRHAERSAHAEARQLTRAPG
jgi:DNA-binding transcriptional LysR family regulator